MSLAIENLDFFYKDRSIFKDFTLTCVPGERLAILGSSGGGKSTLLNIVAGLLPFDKGTLKFNEKNITGPTRSKAIIFQSYALFPWLTVNENLKLVFDQSAATEEYVNEKIKNILKVVGLTEFKEHFPNQLSGGMQQRVAIARALLAEPELLLLDEPFAALDVFHRHKLLEELNQLIDQHKFSSLFVTHNLEDALFFGDRVIVLKNGKIAFDTRLTHLKRKTVSELKSDDNYRLLEKQIYELITTSLT